MMRSRVITPEFFEDEHIAELDPWARLLFIGLWCLADREGRLLMRLRHFRAELFRFDDVITCQDIQRHVMTLAAPHPFIQVYTVDGVELIQIVNFKKYQHVHPHEKRSALPAPPDVIECHVMSGASTSTSTSTYTSLPPITPLSKPAPKQTASRAQLTKQQTVWFTEFWGAYWKRVGKDAAAKKFSVRVRTPEMFAQVMAAIREQTPAMLAKSPEYIPHPATWLHQGRWADEVQPITAITERPRKPMTAYERVLAESEAEEKARCQ